MSQKETTDLGTAIEWIEKDGARVKDKKRKDKTADENRAERSIWRHRSTASMGYSRDYAEGFEGIDWSRTRARLAAEEAAKEEEEAKKKVEEK